VVPSWEGHGVRVRPGVWVLLRTFRMKNRISLTSQFEKRYSCVIIGVVTSGKPDVAIVGFLGHYVSEREHAQCPTWSQLRRCWRRPQMWRVSAGLAGPPRHRSRAVRGMPVEAVGCSAVPAAWLKCPHCKCPHCRRQRYIGPQRLWRIVRGAAIFKVYVQWRCCSSWRSTPNYLCRAGS